MSATSPAARGDRCPCCGSTPENRRPECATYQRDAAQNGRRGADVAVRALEAGRDRLRQALQRLDGNVEPGWRQSVITRALRHVPNGPSSVQGLDGSVVSGIASEPRHGKGSHVLAGAPDTTRPRRARLIVSYFEADEQQHSADEGWAWVDGPWVHFYGDESGCWQSWPERNVICIDWREPVDAQEQDREELQDA